ncbi:MAG: metallophosphoesterase family protein, partial [Clostridia bacterium]|nr:metallophosphoesterase family protein [Clostridia bacterium]
MRIALVADLHGNLPATMAVDADIRRRGADAIWCLGDLIGKGPSSAETFDWAMANCSVILRGNWDEGVALRQFEKNDAYYYEQLGDARMRRLLELPLEHRCTLSGRRVRLIHGRPVMPALQSTNDDEAALDWLFQPDFSLVGYADIHRAGLRSLHGNRLLLSIGSVGNNLRLPMASYAMLSCDETNADAAFDIQFIYLPYDTAQAVRDAEESPGMPKRAAYIQE